MIVFRPSGNERMFSVVNKFSGKNVTTRTYSKPEIRSEEPTIYQEPQQQEASISHS